LGHSQIIIATLFWTTFSFGQTSKDEEFEKTVEQVIHKLANRDSSGLTNFIDKKTGVYILFVVGTKETWEHFTTIGFSDTANIPLYPFYDNVKFSKVNYARLPTFECSTEKWSKTGLYVDTTKIDHKVSKIAKWRNKNYQDNIPVKTISKFIDLEAKSRRVVLAQNNGNELIIYLSYINNKWVLTIIDKATCDCSV
jgi:hypothetical protein